jgi:hypothetical protein
MSGALNLGHIHHVDLDLDLDLDLDVLVFDTFSRANGKDCTAKGIAQSA